MQKLYQSINKILKLAHRLSFGYSLSHTRLCQLADFCSLFLYRSYILPISNVKGT